MTSEQKAITLFREHRGILHTSKALSLGIHPRTLYALRDAGKLVQLGRGLYRLSEMPDLVHPDLVTVALKVPQAVVCLLSALALHELTTQVPHAVVGGKGPIEHFVIRLPALDDRQSVSSIPPRLVLAADEARRELQSAWGSRAPLTEARYQNCWVFGVGRARLHSEHMCLAYLSYPTDESAEANYWGCHPHRLHLHQKSWEYYTALKGQKVLQIEDQYVEINAGETLEIPPGVRHVARALHTPYEGFTFRTPRLDDKVEF